MTRLVTRWHCRTCDATGTKDTEAERHTTATRHATCTHNEPEKK